VIIAHLLQAGQTRLDILALLFVLLRIAYIMMYVADLAKARSAIWALALSSTSHSFQAIAIGVVHSRGTFR
jgi:uncharacterized MAPEG superfamily protein